MVCLAFLFITSFGYSVDPVYNKEKMKDGYASFQDNTDVYQFSFILKHVSIEIDKNNTKTITFYSENRYYSIHENAYFSASNEKTSLDHFIKTFDEYNKKDKDMLIDIRSPLSQGKFSLVSYYNHN